MVTVVDPIDMKKAFVVATEDEINAWVAKAEAGWPKGTAAGDTGEKGAPEDNPENYGQRIDDGAPATLDGEEK